jgi:hypothetical protein
LAISRTPHRQGAEGIRTPRQSDRHDVIQDDNHCYQFNRHHEETGCGIGDRQQRSKFKRVSLFCVSVPVLSMQRTSHGRGLLECRQSRDQNAFSSYLQMSLVRIESQRIQCYTAQVQGMECPRNRRKADDSYRSDGNCPAQGSRSIGMLRSTARSSPSAAGGARRSRTKARSLSNYHKRSSSKPSIGAEPDLVMLLSHPEVRLLMRADNVEEHELRRMLNAVSLQLQGSRAVNNATAAIRSTRLMRPGNIEVVR